MSEIETGGPAFPRTYNGDGHNGATMRDYFAINADMSRFEVSDIDLAALIAGRPMPKEPVDLIRWQYEIVAIARYMAADAMLAARSKA